MHIQNTEALRSWLEACLGKISNAEPAALAKYVVALVKKDKDEEELYSFLLDQLEIFLHQNTKFFVDLLFEVLTNKSYSNFGSEENIKDSVEELLQRGTTLDLKPDFKTLCPASTENSVERPLKKARIDSDNSSVMRVKEPLSPKVFAGEKRDVLLRKKPKFESQLQIKKEKKPEKEKVYTSKRCKDYDEKGFCMKGNSCLYDHGSDPVVVDFNVNADRESMYREDQPLPQELAAVPPLPPMPPPPPPSSPPPLPPLPPPSYIFSPEAYNPESPGMNAPAPALDYQSSYFMHNQSGIPTHIPLRNTMPHPPNHMNSKPKLVRELVIPAVTTTIPNNKNFSHRDGFNRSNQQRDMHGDEQDPKNKRREPIYSRLGPPNPKKNDSRCTLLLRKIPQHLNTIQSINEHFSKFGTVKNIEVNYDGDPEAALVRFSNNSEATTAYRSTEAVMNNRFIRVFYHFNKQPEQVKKDEFSLTNLNSDNKNETSNNAFASKSTVHIPKKKPYLDNKVPENKKSVNYSGRGLVRTVFNPASFVLKNKTSEVSLKAPKEDKKDALQKRMLLHKNFQQLLTSEIKHQQLILARLETCKSQKEKVALKEAFNTLANSISNLSSDCKKTSQELVTLLSENKLLTKADTEKALLDAEIDLYKQQNCLGSNNDTASLLAKVNELKQKAKAMGLIGTSKLPPCEKKKFSSEMLRIDNRTRTLLVSGVDDEETVKDHFLQFGEIEKVESKNGSFTVTFTSRKAAEMAFLNEKQFRNAHIIISWFEKSQSSSKETDACSLDEVKDDSLNLVDEDEDEDDNESRSWRH